MTSLFQYGLVTGGPGVISVGWIVVSFFSALRHLRGILVANITLAMFIGLGMAEIVSAIPTSGGPYFWAYMLAPKNNAAFFSWITGWYVLLVRRVLQVGVWIMTPRTTGPIF